MEHEEPLPGALLIAGSLTESEPGSLAGVEIVGLRVEQACGGGKVPVRRQKHCTVTGVPSQCHGSQNGQPRYRHWLQILAFGSATSNY